MIDHSFRRCLDTFPSGRATSRLDDKQAVVIWQQGLVSDVSVGVGRQELVIDR